MVINCHIFRQPPPSSENVLLSSFILIPEPHGHCNHIVRICFQPETFNLALNHKDPLPPSSDNVIFEQPLIYPRF